MTSKYRNTEGSFFPEGFRDVPVWKDLSNAIDQVFGDNINVVIEKLGLMRDSSAVILDPDTQRNYLLKFLHFSLRQLIFLLAFFFKVETSYLFGQINYKVFALKNQIILVKGSLTSHS